MSDETTLLSCPFCGGEADEYEGDYGNGIYCMMCGAMVGEPIHLEYMTTKRVSIAEAIAAWNTRIELGNGTCENSAKEWGKKTYYFVCSECGWNLANVGRVSIELAAEMIKTCPNCGKRVSA